MVCTGILTIPYVSVEGLFDGPDTLRDVRCGCLCTGNIGNKCQPVDAELV
jgi:hypothetical protein